VDPTKMSFNNMKKLRKLHQSSREHTIIIKENPKNISSRKKMIQN
jgi:hypothetical protein